MFLSKTRAENRTGISEEQHSVVYTNYHPTKPSKLENKENNKK